MEKEEPEEVYSESEEDEDSSSTEESERRVDWFTRQMAHQLSTHEKLLVLLTYVRQSGRFNMITEVGEALMHALYYGVYIGLLRFPSDFYDQTIMDRLEVVHDEWIRMMQGKLDKPIIDVEVPPYVYKEWDRATWRYKEITEEPEHSEKSRPFGPREKGRQHAGWQLEAIADMLPFGLEYNRAQELQARRAPRDDAPSPMSAAQALDVAAYVMQWIGEELYQQLLEKAPRGPVDPRRIMELVQLTLQHPEDRALRYALEKFQARGRVWADLERDTASGWVPDARTTGSRGDDHQADKRYGLSQFAKFIAREQNRAELVRAVRRALHLTIDLGAVRSVQDFKARLPCQQCRVSSFHAIRESQSGLIFCAKTCQRQWHAPQK